MQESWSQRAVITMYRGPRGKGVEQTFTEQ
jgi:hypothetical protein